MLEQQFARYLHGLKAEHRIPLAVELWNGERVELDDSPPVRLKLNSLSAA